MRQVRRAALLTVWALLTAAGGVLLARQELTVQRDGFETDARIAHRLLSQRVVQHDAILATLALLQPAGATAGVEQRLPALYPQIVSVLRREGDAAWPDTALAAAETQSRTLRRPVLADADFAAGRYRLVLAAVPASFALVMDLKAVIPWNEWPMQPGTTPVRLALEQGPQRYALQAGRDPGNGWSYEFRKHLASESQPFDVAARRVVGWAELPWGWILAWALAMAALVGGADWLRRQQAERRRAEELLRLGQVARLNTLGEMAAGLAHELNQPLAALLANTQAARRLVDDDEPDLATARDAMRLAEQQARRASDVLGRLRRSLERPGQPGELQAVVLQDAVRNAFHLLQPEFQRREVQPELAAAAGPVAVRADPVALEQILHNLLTNALQALEQVPAHERNLTVRVAAGPAEGEATLAVTDTGPGIAPEVLPRLFEPFFTTREQGLGLGLSLCESLAHAMGARLTAAALPPRGAVFTLTLPMAGTA